MDPAEDTVQLVIAESERLIQYLTTLPPEAWSTPSACNRWEVRDVVAHLAGQAENYAAWIARSLQGDASTPEGLPAAGSATAASFAEGAAQRVIARREQLGDQILSAFITTNAQLNDRLTSLSPQDWEKPHFFNSLGIAPLRLRPALRLSELVLHGWDIRSRLEANVHLPAESLPVLLGLVCGPFTRWLFRPGPRLPVPIRYRFALTGVGAREIDIVVAGDTASIEPAGAAAATVTCRCDTETFVLIMSGRLCAVVWGHVRSREQERESKGVPPGESHPCPAPNTREQAPASSVRLCFAPAFSRAWRPAFGVGQASMFVW